MRMTQPNKRHNTNPTNNRDSTRNKLFTITFSIIALFITLLSVTFASAASPSTVELDSAGDFGVLAASAVTNTGPTVISEDLGLSPNDNSSITGFFEVDGGPGIVNGEIHAGDATAAQAQLDLTTAYVDAAGRTTNVTIIPSGELGGLNLTSGLYRSGISSFALSTGELTLDAQGDPDAVFIFQMPSSTLTVLSDRQIILEGEADACNIFWQVGSSATLGTDSIVKGNILAFTSITLDTGASLEGRALARNGAVTLDDNEVFSSCANETAPNTTTLTVTKIVVNDDNGTAVVADFDLFINSTEVVSGVETPVVPGTYIVSEIELVGYNGTISGDCAPNGTVTLESGESKQCIITNDDIASVVTPPGNETNTTGNQTDVCYDNLADIPSICVGGNITFDDPKFLPGGERNNCRNIVCESGNESLQIKACGKPTEPPHTYFEMYIEEKTDGADMEICLGDACIGNNDFDTQQLPVCIGNTTSPPPPPTNETNTTGACFTGINSLPVSCNDGTIVTDESSGSCRTIECSNNGDSLTVLACDKPNIGEKTYFEMYVQSVSGSPPEICIAETCLQNEGYKRSTQDYPICIDEEPNPEPEPEPEPTPVCAESVGDLPASCEGGTFTTDSTSGSCRTLVCEGSGSSMQVLACDKPDGSNPEYFEMYKQSQTGDDIQEICLADSCITNGEFDGFERGADYPICAGNVTPPTNGTGNQTNDTALLTSTVLSVAEWYPQGLNVVWVCTPNATGNYTYDFTFGDGHQIIGYSQDNVYHTYATNGTYNATCTVHDTSTSTSVTDTAVIELGIDNTDNSTGNESNDSNVQVITLQNASVANGLSDFSQAAIGNGSWSSNTVDKFEIYMLADAMFTSPIAISDIQSISYETYKETPQNGTNFFLQLYTDPDTCIDPSASWYCSRLTLEPLYSYNLNDSVGIWNNWSTDPGTNQLTVYDQPRSGLFGWYYPPTLQQLQNGTINWQDYSPSAANVSRDYTGEYVKYISIQTGSAWSSGFNESVDNLIVTLQNGTTVIVDLEPMP